MQHVLPMFFSPVRPVGEIPQKSRHTTQIIERYKVCTLLMRHILLQAYYLPTTTIVLTQNFSRYNPKKLHLDTNVIITGTYNSNYLCQQHTVNVDMSFCNVQTSGMQVFLLLHLHVQVFTCSTGRHFQAGWAPSHTGIILALHQF